MGDTIWQVFPSQDDIATKVAAQLQCSTTVAQLLLNRSISSIDQARCFLNEEWNEWPLLPNQDTFANELNKLIENKANICVYGDYDVDGVTSTAILVSLLRQTECNVDYISPHRFNDGYGLNIQRIREVANKKYDALITVDCGVSNKIEIDELLRLAPSTKVLMIDHHKCPQELPNATAIINPQLAEPTHPAYHCCAAALVDYIFRTSSIQNINPDGFIDLVAIGLIADIMPLTNLNRWYVKQGLAAIQQEPRQAILELCISARVHHETISSHDIGFGIGPRMNAPGRLGDPRPVVELLLSNDNQFIQSQVQKIEQINNKRRSIGEKIQIDIDNQIKEDNTIINDKGIICSGQFWHMGIIGINASKLVNKYNKPAVVIGFEDELARGSARSVPGVNIYKILQECEDLLDHFGGHSQAAGFSLKPENIVEFKQKFISYHAIKSNRKIPSHD